MRVLTVTPLFPSVADPAQGVFIKERQRHLPPEIKTVAARFRPRFPLFGLVRRYQASELPAVETVDGIEVHDVRFFYFPGILKGCDGDFLARSLDRFVARHGPFDLLDAHFTYAAGYAAVKVGKRRGLPVVCTERGTIGTYHDAARREKIAWTLRNATRLVAVSASLAAIMKEIGGGDLDVRVVPNGVDGKVFCPGDRSAARARIGIGDDRCVLLTVGGLVPRKGVQRVLERLPSLVARRPNLFYAVVGGGGAEGDHEATVRRKIDESGLGDHVRLFGAVAHDRLVDYYRAADVFVLSTSNEGWANVLSESLATGTPVVTTDVGGNREVVDSKDCGIVVPFGDGAALEAALEAAIEKNWDRAAIARMGSRRSWTAVGRDVADIYREATLGRT